MRRRIRALLRLHNIPCQAGDCYTACIALAALIPNSECVRGYVCFRNQVMAHTWLKCDNWLIDPTCAVNFVEMGLRFMPAIALYRIEPCAVPAE
jgi:hypothetical protein